MLRMNVSLEHIVGYVKLTNRNVEYFFITACVEA